MYNEINKKVEVYIQRIRSHSLWRKAVRLLACLVVFCTTYALILPAITMEQTYYCGIEDHEHTEECKMESMLEEVIEETETIIEETEINIEATETEESSAGMFSLENQQDLMVAAATANVQLNFTSWSEWNGVNFPTGNQYTCPVGSTITIRLADSGGNYVTPNLNITGGTLVSTSFSCGNANCSHGGWCNNPEHIIVVNVTSENVACAYLLVKKPTYTLSESSCDNVSVS